MSAAGNIYSALNLLAPAIALPAFACFERGRQRISDRLGLWDCSLNSCIWLHGASLGETVGLVPVVKEIVKLSPDDAILGTATSPTALTKIGEYAAYSRLLPFDHPLYFEKAVKAVNPKIYVFSETEVWPNLIAYLKNKHIPGMMINARISDSSYRLFRRFDSLFAEALRSLDFIFAADEKSADYFLSLGVSADRLELATNTKYDQPAVMQIDYQQKIASRLDLFSQNLPLVVFASLRPGEQQLVFDAICKADAQGLKLNYIIAPRHKEKFSFFEDALRAKNLNFIKRSETQEGKLHAENILFLDTHGELVDFLALADLAYVGGTLAEGYGGHNPLEAAQYAVPVAIGQWHSKIQDVVRKLEKAGAAIIVKNTDDLLDSFRLSLDQLKIMGENAKKVSDSYAGSSVKVANKIISIIEGNKK